MKTKTVSVFFAALMLLPASLSATQQLSSGNDQGVVLAVNATNAQMVEEMKTAVAKVAKSYGAPPFAFLFSSDPEAAQKVAETVQELNRLKIDRDKLISEIDQLKNARAYSEKQKTESELKAAQSIARAESLGATIQKLQNLTKQERIELNRIVGVKEKMEGELADWANRIEQLRLVAGGAVSTDLSPAKPVGYKSISTGEKFGSQKSGQVTVENSEITK